jgi:Tol biopolymer transport system component
MTDLDERFRSLVRTPTPDLWAEIDGREVTDVSGPTTGRRLLVAAVAFVVAIAGVGVGVWALRPDEQRARPATAVSNGAIAFTSGVGSYHLATVTLGGAMTDLTRPTGGEYDLGPVWSPDGTSIAFLRYTITNREDGLGDYELFVSNADGTDVVDFDRSAGAPSWSPDGSMIAFSSFRKDTDYDIVVASRDGVSSRVIVDSPLSDTTPRWSPLGDAIAFTRYPVLDRDPGDEDIYVVGPDGTGLTKLTGGPEWDSEPVWSPDGTRIAYLSAGEIRVMNADGSGKVAVTDAPTNDVGNPVGSPDGSRIAFVVHSGTSWDVYVVNADGTGQIALATTPLDETGPEWSPDGSLIAYSAAESSESCQCDNSGSFDIYVMRPDGTGTRRLTTGAQELGGDLSWQVVREAQQPSPTETPADEEAPPIDPTITATIAIGAFPRGVAVAEGAIWATVDNATGGPDEHLLVQIDPSTNEIVRTVRLPQAGDVAYGAGDLWVTSWDGQQSVLLRVDRATAEVTDNIPLGWNADDVAFGFDAVWVTVTTSEASPSGEVLRIDPETNEVVARIPVDTGWPRDVVVGEGHVWAYGHSKLGEDGWQASSLWRIDPSSNQLVTVLDQNGFLGDGGFLPNNVAVGEGWVWAASDSGNGVRIDAASGGLTSFRVGDDPNSPNGFGWPYAVYRGHVLFGLGAVRVLDTETLEVVAMVDLESQVADAALDAATGTLWIANYEGTVTRIDLR